MAVVCVLFILSRIGLWAMMHLVSRAIAANRTAATWARYLASRHCPRCPTHMLLMLQVKHYSQVIKRLDQGAAGNMAGGRDRTKCTVCLSVSTTKAGGGRWACAHSDHTTGN